MNEPQPRPVWPSPPKPDQPPARSSTSPPTPRAAKAPLLSSDDGTNRETSTAGPDVEQPPDDVAALFAAATPPLPSERHWMQLRDRIVAQLPSLSPGVPVSLCERTGSSTPYRTRLQRLRNRPVVVLTATVAIGVTVTTALTYAAVFGVIMLRGPQPAGTAPPGDFAVDTADFAVDNTAASPDRTTPLDVAAATSPAVAGGMELPAVAEPIQIAWANDGEVMLVCVPLTEDVWLPVGRSPLSEPIVVARGGDIELLDVSASMNPSGGPWSIDAIAILFFEPR